MEKNDFYKKLGKKLKKLRRVNNVSQETIGDIIGIHQTAVCRVEKGHQKLTAHELYLLAEFYKISVSSILQ